MRSASSYKAGVDDLRESPALIVMERMLRKGADVTYHDPFVSDIEIGGRHLHSVELDDADLAQLDCALILTAHPGIDWRALVGVAPLVFDTRGVTAGLDAPNVVRL